jgi:hypothetical protein
METTLMILVFFTMLLLAIVVQLFTYDEPQTRKKTN